MKTKNLLISLGVVVLLVLGVTFPRSGGTVVEKVITQFGGPESTNDFQCYAGVCHYYRNSKNLATATTTPCAVKSPAATSTMLFARFANTTPTSTAATIRIATSTTPFATTTVYFATALSANQTNIITFIASTTNTDGQNMTLKPNTFVVFDAEGSGTTFGHVLPGYCQAEFVGPQY